MIIPAGKTWCDYHADIEECVKCNKCFYIQKECQLRVSIREHGCFCPNCKHKLYVEFIKEQGENGHL